MEDNKLLIGGILIIALLFAIPVIGPKLRGSNYDPVADTHKMDTLSNAVMNYARVNNQYPPSLHHLVPKFLPAVPLNSMNAQFQYDPRSGKVINPSAPSAESGQQIAGRRGSGGISPATDAMTGLGVSQELNF